MSDRPALDGGPTAARSRAELAVELRPIGRDLTAGSEVLANRRLNWGPFGRDLTAGSETWRR